MWGGGGGETLGGGGGGELGGIQYESLVRCVLVPLCTSPIVYQPLCVPVPLCPSFVYRFCCVPAPLCISPIVGMCVHESGFRSKLGLHI